MQAETSSEVQQSVTKEQQRYEVRLTIVNWDVGSLPGNCIESKPLELTRPATGQPKLTWFLKFYPRGLDRKASKPVVSLTLLPVPAAFSPAEARVQLKWSLTIAYADVESPAFKYCSAEITVDRKGAIWQESIGNSLKDNAAITINCTIDSCTFDYEAPSGVPSKFSKNPQKDFHLKVSNPQALRSDFTVAFESPKAQPAADLTVSYGKGETLEVHRYILQVRSPVFRVMFSTNCMEQSTGELKLDDCSDKTAVTAFFRYLYCGFLILHSSESLRDTLRELVYLANKYCVECLLQDLERCLLSNIGVLRPHLVLLTDLAYTHDLTELSAKCVQLSKMGVFPNRDDKLEVTAFKSVVAGHVQLAWDLLGLS